MKKLIAMALSLAMIATVFAGCAAKTETPAATTTAPAATTEAAPAAEEAAPAAEEAAPAAEEAASLSGSVTVGGSTSVESVILAAMQVFMEANPDVTITYDPTGSSTGVKSAADGSYDIGLASRDVKSSETEELKTVGTVFAIDGIAIIVNTANAVADLSVEQVASIADGTITNWSELGGADAPIVLIGREAGSGTRDGFESIIGVEECVYEQELASTGGVIGAVQQNPNAIGYASVAAVEDTVTALTIEGVEATEANIQDGSYKFQRNFNFVTVEGKEMSPAAEAFYNFVLSAEAASLVSGAGAVPVA